MWVDRGLIEKYEAEGEWLCMVIPDKPKYARKVNRLDYPELADHLLTLPHYWENDVGALFLELEPPFIRPYSRMLPMISTGRG